MPSSVTLTVSHLPTSTSFFLSALQPLNYIYRGRVNNTIGFGTADAPPDFWLTQEIAGVPAGAAHVAFPATSRQQVHDFFIAAVKGGGKCHGEPMLRDQETGYFSAAIIDFDGNSIEAVFRPDLVASDSSDESRSGSIVSASSNKSRSTMKSKAPSVISNATAKSSKSRSQAVTEVRSVAPSQARSSVSMAPPKSTVSRVPTEARSVAPSQARSSVSTAIPRSTVFRAPAEPAANTNPSGDMLANIMAEARGAVSMARELVDQVRPHLPASISAPNVNTATPGNLQSHQPSDTIVGTLLGVAAGAAMHYAYSKATQSATNDAGINPPLDSYPPPRPSVCARSKTDGSLVDERYYYYHEHANRPSYQAIEPAPSAYSSRGQRYITMHDAEGLSQYDHRESDYAPSVRSAPRRRSSFSGGSTTSTSRDSRVSRSMKMLEGPPTAYRMPTALTAVETTLSTRSRPRSLLSSMVRAASVSSSSRSRRFSADDDDDDFKSFATKSVASSRHSSSRHSAVPSEHGSERTVVPLRSSESTFDTKSRTSRAPSHTTHASRRSPSPFRSQTQSRTSKTSKITVLRDSAPESYPLPPSRAATWAGSDAGTTLSMKSKGPKTVIGRMKERDLNLSSARSGVTKSVIGKVNEMSKLDLPDEEVKPCDSVSQISSSAGSRRSRRSKA